MKITKKVLHKLIKETKEEYQEFFNKTLKKFDVKSVAELDDNKKKEFFNYIEDNWNSADESGKDGPKECKTKKKKKNESVIKETSKFSFGKVMNFIEKDDFLNYAFKTMKGNDKDKAEKIFNSHILGDKVMEKRYNKVK